MSSEAALHHLDAAPPRRENFPVASLLLPRSVRRHLLAVYGFARRVDDIGDEAPPGERRELLDAVDADLRRLYAGRPPHLGVVRVLAPTVRACAVPAEPFHHLVEANRRDQEVSRYETFADLLGYCALSANPVGRIVLHVFGAATPDRIALSDRICSALQILEHCQDVGEDLARGRVYLPAEDLRRLGCAEADLTAVQNTEPLRDVVALQTRRAAHLLDEGAPLVGTLPGVARTAVAGYVAGGRAVVAALERHGHDVLGRAVRPRRTVLLRAWLRILARGR
ncbi:squalene synthase HpnC [Microbispora corallina]|uniref:Phytoene synthase n=1 Tax=Microbispora corallina TaxID=83302 RepID=A0ABQ4FYZ9_9ACTN|nr:squalene synthase HpnC [Microbispora corallina]GIH40047.1 phytoene synthase [Microbispora corallina]